MIVGDPPYDLVALFADLDTQKLLEKAIERRQGPHRGCIRPIRWRSERDPRRDPVWRDPLRALRPFVAGELFREGSPRFLVVWDHEGSGQTGPADESERFVVDRLVETGVVDSNRVCAVAVEPELEATFAPSWERIARELANLRGATVPAEDRILGEARRLARETESRERNRRLEAVATLEEALSIAPKAVFEALVWLVDLRSTATVYQRIGAEVSSTSLKRAEALGRIAATLEAWFPPGVDAPEASGTSSDTGP